MLLDFNLFPDSNKAIYRKLTAWIESFFYRNHKATGNIKWKTSQILCYFPTETYNRSIID